ncbi:hemolysin family protein [Dactylosporangium sp. AC04546]|uniref:hemolysin family protein n=1 Tax=Dactylosporangium sp. AC04546 TaxID=2862460 RepID=UPI001EE0B5FB|nr:hemolysin family protein [Dactylosporangium sp. AC04546]WVK83794.1 hemolysin family protein [Dactylosporangium sp. AC04546]
MNSTWIELTLVLVLTLLNAAFSGSEMALISLREGQLRRLERQGGAGRTLVKLARDPNRFLSTIQIGITLAGFLASATAAVSLAEPVVPLLDFLGGAANVVAIVLVTLALTFVTLVIGELAPKRIAMQRAESWAMLVARPLYFLSAALRPVNWVLGKSSDLVVRLAGADPNLRQDEMSPEELRDLVATQRSFSRQQRLIISGAVEIVGRTLREVLVPRPSVLSLNADLPAQEAAAELAASGHSRAPVVSNGDLDSAIGIVHWADLIRADGPVRAVMRPALLLPESLPVAQALQRFKAERQQLALVVDERGAIDGIVTLEDLIEEVVGEIYDETDKDIQQVQRQNDGSLLLPGSFPIHDLPDIGIDLERLPGSGYTTIAGLVLATLGHLPTAPGESATVGLWTFTVSQVRGRAISAVTARQAAMDRA